jgi:hypothetical protein
VKLNGLRQPPGQNKTRSGRPTLLGVRLSLSLGLSLIEGLGAPGHGQHMKPDAKRFGHLEHSRKARVSFCAERATTTSIVEFAVCRSPRLR